MVGTIRQQFCWKLWHGCLECVAGQTHAVYDEGGQTFVGTGRFGRTDLAFEGGVIHEVTSVLMVLYLVRDSHSEQVWKKSLQPSPILSAIGGVSTLGAEFEIHGCLLHAATGQLVPEALRGHVRPLKRGTFREACSVEGVTSFSMQ